MTPEGRGGESRPGPPPREGRRIHQVSSLRGDQDVRRPRGAPAAGAGRARDGACAPAEDATVATGFRTQSGAGSSGACCGPGNELGLSARMPRVLP